MKSYHYVFVLVILFFSCENSRVTDNPADYAGDYALDEASFHGEAKEKFADAAIMEETEIENVEDIMEVPVNEQPPPQPPSESADRKLIKTAHLSVEVNDLARASQTLDSLLKSHQAYISQDELQNSPNRKHRNLTLRVPSAQLDLLVTRLSAMGNFLASRSVYVRDVSMEYTDTELRLKSKRAVLEQYLKLLDRAEKMEDVLKIEKEIRLIREEIEAKEGQLRYLSNQVTLSTIHLEMYQDITQAKVAPSDSFWRKAGDRLVFGWNLIKGVSLVMISLWPLWILAGVVWTFVRMWKRKKRLAA